MKTFFYFFKECNGMHTHTHKKTISKTIGFFSRQKTSGVLTSGEISSGFLSQHFRQTMEPVSKVNG